MYLMDQKAWQHRAGVRLRSEVTVEKDKCNSWLLVCAAVLK
jgi:hypothetical protein